MCQNIYFTDIRIKHKIFYIKKLNFLNKKKSKVVFVPHINLDFLQFFYISQNIHLKN